jgi:hypothetical protein
VRGGRGVGQAREASRRLDLDLADALAGQAEPAADLFECFRLVVVEAVAQHEHQPLTLAKRGQRLLERLAAEQELDLLVRQELLASDQVTKDSLFLIAHGLIEARHHRRSPI